MKPIIPSPVHMRLSGQYRVDSNGLSPVEISPGATRGVVLSLKSAMGANEGAPGERDWFKLTLPRPPGQKSNTLKPTVELTYFRLSLANEKASQVTDAVQAANLGYTAVIDWSNGTLSISPKP